MLTSVQDPSKATSETPLDKNSATQPPKVKSTIAYDTDISDRG